MHLNFHDCSKAINYSGHLQLAYVITKIIIFLGH